MRSKLWSKHLQVSQEQKKTHGVGPTHPSGDQNGRIRVASRPRCHPWSSVRVGLLSSVPCPSASDPSYASRNAVNAPLTLLWLNMIGYACSRRNSEEGRIAVVLGHVPVSPSRCLEPAAPRSPSKPIPSPIYCSRDGSIKDRLSSDSAVSLPRDRVKIHVVSRHSILTAPPQPIFSRFLAPCRSTALIHRSLEGSLARERAQNR